jgi:hypothetical protein
MTRPVFHAIEGPLCRCRADPGAGVIHLVGDLLLGKVTRDVRAGRGTREFCPRPPLDRPQLATMAMPKGVAPVGSAVGDDVNSVREPPLTAKPLTDAIAASTT